MELPSSFDELIEVLNQSQLYKNLISQLNKDLLLANVDLSFHEDTLPYSLKLVLIDKVCQLIQEKFTEYLNLLYIIDVSEEKVKSLNIEEIHQLSEAITFLILQREWQKVWFKAKY